MDFRLVKKQQAEMCQNHFWSTFGSDSYVPWQCLLAGNLILLGAVVTPEVSPGPGALAGQEEAGGRWALPGTWPWGLGLVLLTPLSTSGVEQPLLPSLEQGMDLLSLCETKTLGV